MKQAELRQQLFNLIKKEAFFKQKVVLSSGKTSTCYIDIRRISLQSKGAYFIAGLLWEQIKNEIFSAIGGPTLGADPILSSLAYHAQLKNRPIKTFIVRKEKKQHGRQQILEGPPINKDSKVIIVDDVATSGKSLVETIKKLQPLGIKAIKACVIIDRDEGAREALSRYNCPLLSLFKLKEFITG